MAITEITRVAIIDYIMDGLDRWSGRLEEDAFLSRLYPLHQMPSRDRRFKDAAGDIWQHRVMNPEDWDDDWVFYDSRFELLHGDDATFLRFLCETVHPMVRPDPNGARVVVEGYNKHLRHDGYELAPGPAISGRPVYVARSLLEVPVSLREIERSEVVANREYLSTQITRMESAIHGDPELAIGTAKEMIETVCKTILDHRSVAYERSWDLPRLMKETAKVTQLTPDGVPDDAPAADTIRKILGSLSSVVAGTAELRNAYGTGHGKGPAQAGLQPRHARLVVGAASTLAMFLFETFEHHST